jgi:hypothetical protein
LTSDGGKFVRQTGFANARLTNEKEKSSPTCLHFL